MFILQNLENIQITSHNLGTTASRQTANGVSPVDPPAWTPKRYELGDTVLGADGNVYRYVINNNAIPRADVPNTFESIEQIADRVAADEERTCPVTSVLEGSDGAGFFHITMFPVCPSGERPRTGTAFLTGTLRITAFRAFTWDGMLVGSRNRAESDGFESTATLISGSGTANQSWRVTRLPVNLENYAWLQSKNAINVGSGNQPGASPSFTGTLTYLAPDEDGALNDIYGYQNPAPSSPIVYPSGRGFIGDIQWWVRIRSNAQNAFFDEKPASGIGRRGGVELRISSPDSFSEICLYNVICTRAFVNATSPGSPSSGTTKIPISPMESSILLFTNLTPRRSGSNYIATIQIFGDNSSIPSQFSSASGRPIASVGQVIIGDSVSLGNTDANSWTKSLLDFSEVNRTDEGDFVVFERDSTFEMDATTIFPRRDTQEVSTILERLAPAKPALFYVCAEESFGSLLYGIMQGADIRARRDDEDLSQVALSISGLV